MTSDSLRTSSRGRVVNGLTILAGKKMSTLPLRYVPYTLLGRGWLAMEFSRFCTILPPLHPKDHNPSTEQFLRG